MSALESLLRRRGTRRHPMDEVLPDGTPAAQVLMPRILRLPTEGEGVPLGAPPIETLPPAPDALPLALRPRRVFTPPEFEESAPPAVPEGVSYEPGTLAPRRRWSSPFNQEGERNAAIRDVLSDPSQLPKAGKLERWLLNPLQRAAQGIAATGSLAGGLGGLGVGFVEGAVNPRAATEMKYQGKLAQSDERLGQLQAQADAGLKRRGAMANVLKTEAETRNLLNLKPKEIAPHYETRDDGTYVVDAQNPEGRKLSGVPGRPAAQGRPQTVRLKNADGSESVYERGADNVWKDTGLKSAGQPRRKITLGGETFELPEAEAARVLAQIESANITSGNQYGNQSYEDTVRQQERQYGQTLSQWEAAGREQARLVKAVEELNKAVLQRDATTDAEDRVAWEAAAKTAKATVEKIASTLSSAYGDFVENDAQGWPTKLRPRPAAPAPPQRPAPQRRSVGAAPRSSAPKTPPVSEEAYLATARERLGSAYDEAKARAAYRQRYGR